MHEMGLTTWFSLEADVYQKYSPLCSDLEAARAKLDEGIQSERQVIYVLDHALELVAQMQFRRQKNVIEFPVRKPPKRGRLPDATDAPDSL